MLRHYFIGIVILIGAILANLLASKYNAKAGMTYYRVYIKQVLLNQIRLKTHLVNIFTLNTWLYSVCWKLYYQKLFNYDKLCNI